MLGEDWWQEYRAVIIAGAGTGIGVSVGIVAGLAIILRSMWAVRYKNYNIAHVQSRMVPSMF